MVRGGTAVLSLLVALLLPSAAAAQWTQQALDHQYDLAADLPLRNTPWVGTHNSFNSPAEMGPALSAQDSNQKITLVEQLDLGVRSLELDVHWFFSPSEGGFAPVVCHATGQHAGCTVEKPLATVLDEIRGWSDRHPDQVILLYLEDHLDSEEGYDAAARVVEEKLGDVLYRPSGTGCSELPLELKRGGVETAGKRFIAVSDCGLGSGWPSVVFDWSAHVETRPRGYQDFPDCGPDFDRATYERTIVRYFEDSTRLTNTGAGAGVTTRDDGIRPETAARMARCGVDLTGLDQLVPGDARLDALVWSWAPGEPSGGACALQRVDAGAPYGRFDARSCTEKHAAACRSATGTWTLSSKRVRAADAAVACSAAGSTHSVPRTGYEAQLLRVAMEQARARTAWLAYHASGASWTPLDPR